MTASGKNRISGTSLLSDEEFVVIRLGNFANSPAELSDHRGIVGRTNNNGEGEGVAVQTRESLGRISQQRPSATSRRAARPPSSSDSDKKAISVQEVEPSGFTNNTQIQRIVMKKERSVSVDKNSSNQNNAVNGSHASADPAPVGGQKVMKKDSVASIIVDTKESLKTPVIVQTRSIDSATSEYEESSSLTGKVKRNLTPLKQTDLPRSLRSTRRLSACNDKVLMEMQQKMMLNAAAGSSPEHTILNASRRSSRRSSNFLMENAKAMSLDGYFPGGSRVITNVQRSFIEPLSTQPLK